jgi:hypothetical protein
MVHLKMVAVVTTHKTTAMGRTGATGALRPSETTSPLSHLDWPHKQLRTEFSKALRPASTKARPASNRVRLEAATEEVMNVAVGVVATTRGPGKTNEEGTARVVEGATSKEATVATEATAATRVVMEVEAMAAIMAVEAKEVEEDIREISKRAIDQLR